MSEGAFNSVVTEPVWKFAPGLHHSSVAAAFTVSMKGRITYANDRALSLLKRESVDVLKRLSFRRKVLSDCDQWQHWRTAAERGVHRNIEVALLDSDGERIHLRGDLWAETHTSNDNALVSGIFVDVTDMHAIKEGFGRTARLEAVGSLMAGVVHDINNVFTVLMGNLYLAGEAVRSDEKAFIKIKRAREAARRGGDLGRQLLTFARGGELDESAINPMKLIGELAPLLATALGKGITLRTAVDKTVGAIRGNRAQLESAIVNLAFNARDALNGSGNITIRATNADPKAAGTSSSGSTQAGLVQISVIDDGPGISTENQARVFEPFYTTKDIQRGTGLGLSMVRWLCEQSGGSVKLSSKLGHGTIVSMMLPRDGGYSTDTTEKTMPLSVLPTGTEAVCLVADDENIRWTVAQILEAVGYSVCAFESLLAAVDSRSSEPVDLLLVDNSIFGEMNVDKIVEHARQAFPRSKVIFIDDSNRYSGLSNIDVLRKPFSLFELSVLVRQTLDGPGHA